MDDELRLLLARPEAGRDGAAVRSRSRPLAVAGRPPRQARRLAPGGWQRGPRKLFPDILDER